MQILVSDNVLIKISKRILVFFLSILGVFIINYVLNALYNLGIYLGTFLRGLYNLVC